MASIKIGNTSFNADAVKDMTFKEFVKAYSHLEELGDLKAVFKELGGKVTAKKAKKDDDSVRPSD